MLEDEHLKKLNMRRIAKLTCSGSSRLLIRITTTTTSWCNIIYTHNPTTITTILQHCLGTFSSSGGGTLSSLGSLDILKLWSDNTILMWIIILE